MITGKAGEGGVSTALSMPVVSTLLAMNLAKVRLFHQDCQHKVECEVRGARCEVRGAR
jgi:hypothetical protein